MRGLVLAALIAGSSVCWVAAEVCKGRFGVVKPDVLIGIDPEESPLRSVAVTYRGETFTYKLEQLSSNKVSEFYNLHTESGELAGITKKSGAKTIAGLIFYRKKQFVVLTDLWADGGVRAACQKIVKKD